MSIERRQFLQTSLMGLAAVGLRGASVLEAQTNQVDLVISLAGLCAFIPTGDVVKVGLLDALYEPQLQLHAHKPILVARKINVLADSAVAESCYLPTRVAGWTGLEASNLCWWPLDGANVSVLNHQEEKPDEDLGKVGSIKNALKGRPHEYPKKNPLLATWSDKKNEQGRKLVSSVVTLRGGEFDDDGPVKIKGAKDIKWRFKDNKENLAHEQQLTDTIRYELERSEQVHVIQIGGKKIFLGNRDDQSAVECWILNIPFKKIEVSTKKLSHFAAFYDLLRDTVPIDERPVPTTETSYAMEVEYEARTVDVLGNIGQEKRATETVYCPGSVF